MDSCSAFENNKIFDFWRSSQIVQKLTFHIINFKRKANPNPSHPTKTKIDQKLSFSIIDIKRKRFKFEQTFAHALRSLPRSARGSVTVRPRSAHGSVTVRPRSARGRAPLAAPLRFRTRFARCSVALSDALRSLLRCALGHASLAASQQCICWRSTGSDLTD